MTDPERIPDRLTDALRGVPRSGGGENVVDAGMVHGLDVSGEGDVRFELGVRSTDRSDLVRKVRQAAAAVEGVRSVRVSVRAEGDSTAGESVRAEGDARAEEGGRVGSGRSLPVMGQGGGGEPRRSGSSGHSVPEGAEGPRPKSVDRGASSRHPSEAPPLEGVRNVLAVSSGKGGVGKSTIATNLAAAWSRMGHRVGLMDADVYGPDIPTMFGAYEKPRMAEDRVIPLEAHGVKLMSIGFLVDEDTPAIWRGPIIMGIVRQFLQQVHWGELDYLVVDLPPGTGDAQLSLVQLVEIVGGVFVTTPQDVAVGGVLKGVKMFERLEVPIAGLVENMRGFVCPECESRHEIFGSGGGEKLAASLGVPFLGDIPLGTAVREEGDRGMPTVLGRPESPEARAMMAMAEATRERIDALGARERSGAQEGAGAPDPSARPAGSGATSGGG